MIHGRAGTTICRSSIDGYGLFAVRPFESGDVSATVTQYVVFREARKGTVRRNSTEHLLDARVIRWINHSCSPNARVIFQSDTVVVVAQRPIRAGHEITCDYGATEEGEIPEPFHCKCGHCNGRTIGGGHEA